MTSLKKLLVVLAASLPLAASAQPAAEPPPAAPPPPAAEPTPPPPAPAKPAAAPAAKPLFQLYGTLNVNYQLSEAPTATNRAQSIDYRTGVSVDSTNVGIRGTADVAYGLGIVYQCETSAQVDAIGVSGICNRNSRLGVSSPYGTLFYGNWDTPYKAMAYGTKADDPFGNTDVYGFQNLFGSPGFNTRSTSFVSAAPGAPSAGPPATGFPAGSATQAFDIRAQNSVAYHSPKVMGVSAKLQYSAEEFSSANNVLTPRLYSAAVNFDFGPLSVTGAAEFHEDAAGLAAMNPTTLTTVARPFGATAGNTAQQSSMDWAWRVMAGYELATPFGTTTLMAGVEQLTYEQETAPANAVTDYDRLSYVGGVKHRLGNHEFRARYALAEEGDCELQGGGACSTDGFGAWNLALGYAHHLSKAAQVYAYYSLIENEANAQYTFATAGIPTIAGATPRGADPYAVGLGLRYAF